MTIWPELGKNNYLSRYLLESAGVKNPYSMGWLWGLGVEESMAKEFVKLLKESEYYRPNEERPKDRQLPQQLAQF
ncbi:hypothetical protein GYA19_05705 [Candidatus Beckwithbacteria bacterium]|nr:hypothetical protein [Candidatus Beckwithbacteria bacterium]